VVVSAGPLTDADEPLVGFPFARDGAPAYRFDMTFGFRRRIYAVAVALLAFSSCRPHRAAHPLELANRGATFEVRLTGCSTAGVTGRRFGTNIRTALLWSGERVHSASYLPCTATIDAVRGVERHAVYRMTHSRDGSYLEEILHGEPRTDSVRGRVPPA